MTHISVLQGVAALASNIVEIAQVRQDSFSLHYLGGQGRIALEEFWAGPEGGL